MLLTKRSNAGRNASSVTPIAIDVCVMYFSTPVICALVASVVALIVAASFSCAAASSAAAFTASPANANAAPPATANATAAFFPNSVALSPNVSVSLLALLNPSTRSFVSARIESLSVREPPAISRTS